jgi:hypothetical protein
MGADAGASAVLDAAMADQDPVNGRDGGNRNRGVCLEQELVEFASAPAPSLAELEDLANHRRRGRVRALLRAIGAIGEALGPEPGVAVEPLVTGLAADAIAPTELGEGGGGVLGIEHEALALVHG